MVWNCYTSKLSPLEFITWVSSTCMPFDWIIPMLAIVLFVIDHAKLPKCWVSKSIHTDKTSNRWWSDQFDVLVISLTWLMLDGDTQRVLALGFFSLFYEGKNWTNFCIVCKRENTRSIYILLAVPFSRTLRT